VPQAEISVVLELKNWSRTMGANKFKLKELFLAPAYLLMHLERGQALQARQVQL
jgi:hypothetical protein